MPPPRTQNSFVGTLTAGRAWTHTQLFSADLSLTDSKINIMMSNADVALVRENFNTDDKYTTTSIL
jgi:hypothetical protein